MNRIYSKVWNKSLGQLVVASEFASRAGKAGKDTSGLVRAGTVAGTLMFALAFATPAWAQTALSGTGSNTKGATADTNCGTNFVDRKNPGNPNGSGDPQYILKNGCSTAVGDNAKASNASVAIGDRSQASDSGVAIGVGALSTKNSAIAIGTVALATGNTSFAMGRQSAATADYAMAIGNVAYANGESGIAMGHSANASGYRSIAIGAADSRNAGNDGVSAGASYLATSQTRASGDGAVALGAGAIASVNDSVAMGSSSVGAANASGTAKFSGDAIAAGGAVSVGKAGAERQIKNVAGGTVGTDAVNVNQLTAVNTKVAANTVNIANLGGRVTVNEGDIAALQDDALQWDATANGGTGAYSAKHGGAGPNKLIDVADGTVAAGSTDAVNGSQLSAVSDIANNANKGWNVQANGGTATQVTPGSTVNFRNGQNIAINNNGTEITVATVDTPSFKGADMGGGKITGVKAGDLSSGSTDAVNGSQLDATNINVSNLGDQVTAIDGRVTTNEGDIAALQDDALQWDASANGGIGAYSAKHGGTGPNKIADVADGELSATSTDAVNGSQLNTTNQNVTMLGDTLTAVAGDTSATYVENNGRGVKYVRTNDTGLAEDDAHATVAGATALGYNATASHEQSVAIGRDALADGSTLGNAAYTVNAAPVAGTAIGEISVGKVGSERRVTNVAAGSGDTDAVNVSQLKAVADNVDSLAGNAVKYDDAGRGQVTLGGTGGTVVTNVKDGDVSDSSTDAVNGSQLYAVDQKVDQNTTDITNNTTDIAALQDDALQWDATANGGTGAYSAKHGGAGPNKLIDVADGTVAAGSTDAVNGGQLSAVSDIANNANKGWNVQANGGTATQVTPGSTVNFRNGQNIAISNNGTEITVATVDTPSFKGADMGGEKVTGVKAGDLSNGSTDAVNGSQLDATNINVSNLGDQVTAIDGRVTTNEGDIAALQDDALQWDASANGGTGAYSAKHGGTGPNKLTDVADGELSATSTDAVNGSQLNTTNQNVTMLGDTLTAVAGDTSATYVENNGRGVKYVRTNDTGLAEDDAHATVAGATALGYNATASHEQSVAIGRDALADGSTLGNTAYLVGGTAIGEVSVGKAGSERRVTNVAAGSGDTDAVNVSQLKKVAGDLDDLAGNAVQYDDAGKGQVTLGGAGGAGGTVVTNLKDGDVSATSKDAVNGSQLYAVDQKVEQNTGDIAALLDDALLWDPAANGGVGAYSAKHGGTGPNKIADVADGELSATSTDAVNGSQLNTTNQNVTALGDTLTAVAGDTGATYVENNGRGVKYVRTNDTGLAGDDAHATVAGATALGYNAVASQAWSVALGRESLADGGSLGMAAYLVGGTAIGEVSVGKTGSERRVTNVAAGATDTDAVNVGQLKKVVGDLDDLAGNAVQYDDAGKGKVTLGGVGGTVISNVKDGDVSDGSSEAVNGSQLYAVQAQVNQNTTSITLLDGRVTSIEGSISNINNGSVGMFQVSQDHNTPPPAPTGLNSAAGGAGAQAAGDNSLALGNDSKAAGTGSTALGNAAEARQDGDVALGAGALADRGAESYTGKYSGAQNDSVGTVSVGNAETGETRTVSNVADGKEATDAVNLRQLDGAVAESKSYTDNRIGDVVNNINNGATGMFQVSQDHNAPAPSASGSDSVAGGSGAVASGDKSAALGNDTVASGSASTAVGNGAQATADNSVALGAGSVADRADSVSVGAAGQERQITNVASGTKGTDAVNVSQLKEAQAGSVQYDVAADGSTDYGSVTLNQGGSASTLHNVAAGTAPTDAANVGQLRDGLQETKDWARDYADQRFRQVGREANAGVASAMAMAGLPQAYEPGRSMAAVAASSFRGESSLAIGVSTISESGRWVYKLTGSTNSRGDGGVTVGAGMQW